MTVTPHTERRTPRAMLAAIALATNLPVPKQIDFTDDYLHLIFACVADGVAWATFIGTTAEPYLNADGRRYLGSAPGSWHGWPIGLHASEAPDVVDDLPDEDQDALAALVEQAAR